MCVCVFACVCVEWGGGGGGGERETERNKEMENMFGLFAPMFLCGSALESMWAGGRLNMQNSWNKG